MSPKLIFYFYCSLLLFVGSQATYSEEEFDENAIDYDDEIDEREKFIDTITADYLEIIDYEVNQSKELFQNVLADSKISYARSEILQGKKLILENFIQYVNERQERQMPPPSHRAALFFHVFGKSLIYKDFLGIVARLEPTQNRYDDMIEDALFANGIEDFLGTLREMRASLIKKTIRKIEKYVDTLTASERRKAAAQKLIDWAENMKNAPTLERKMEIFQDCLRYEYLERKVPVVDF
ncbi:uncharacterized protein [Eurosta solidaginis]|uniref:uncharacterized protein n=1 Tax=Eurosta solidaginis TaxID=178769 RepID=UPI003530EF84